MENKKTQKKTRRATAIDDKKPKSDLIGSYPLGESPLR
jgi:hypothetical protein